jgi:hypothetical protein
MSILKNSFIVLYVYKTPTFINETKYFKLNKIQNIKRFYSNPKEDSIEIISNMHHRETPLRTPRYSLCGQTQKQEKLANCFAYGLVGIATSIIWPLTVTYIICKNLDNYIDNKNEN